MSSRSPGWRARRSGRRRARRERFAAGSLAGLALAASALTSTPAYASADGAHAAGTIALEETGRLRLTSHRGFTLNEQGLASGTVSGTIYIHLNVVSTNHVTAEVNIYPSGGSLTARASASYRPAGAVASFSGTLQIVRGTGRYGHATGAGLSFTGTVQRANDAVTVHVGGRISV